ncbi:barstar family protein [Sphingomonas endolithica]|uniref:barstar family protein n=1 Tax=Sphingomonas endolithica TaxID=2972485 RepID=UPI0021B04282|nr:barstar family protein [Sphingomonas sp. ZFBP2030]
MTKMLTIIGTHIHDIPSFYDEINRVFMSGEGWTLGESLDAFDDMLRGGYGAISGGEPIRLVWQDIDQSRARLGVEVTRTFLQGKLDRPELYNAKLAAGQLEALDEGRGKTYFEIVVAIIAEHPNIELVAA